MSDPFDSTVLSVSAAAPGFKVDVWHFETQPGGKREIVEKYKFPIIAWAVVRVDDWDKGREMTRVEPVFLWNQHPTTTSDYRRSFSDLAPSVGEPKRTVGVFVVEPPGYMA